MGRDAVPAFLAFVVVIESLALLGVTGIWLVVAAAFYVLLALLIALLRVFIASCSWRW